MVGGREGEDKGGAGQEPDGPDDQDAVFFDVADLDTDETDWLAGRGARRMRRAWRRWCGGCGVRRPAAARTSGISRPEACRARAAALWGGDATLPGPMGERGPVIKALSGAHNPPTREVRCGAAIPATDGRVPVVPLIPRSGACSPKSEAAGAGQLFRPVPSAGSKHRPSNPELMVRGGRGEGS